MQHNVKMALEQVERAVAKSQQPRFNGQNLDTSTFFTSVMNWVGMADKEEPPYRVDSRVRDHWLSNFWLNEPHLAGVMSSVNAIDANRGWQLTGGRNQVLRFLPVFREADNGAGWRQYISQQSQAFYSTDLGALTETAREGKGGPLREMYHLDPTKCYLTGNFKAPLRYNRTSKDWTSDDFFRLVSMKNLNEDFRGLGYCALSRCLEMARIMMALYGYQLEQLGARAPKGLLLLQNISQDQWQEAMKTREAAMDSDMRKYYNAVAVIAQQGIDSIDAKLVALSNLPQGFDLNSFTNLLMYAYSLCFNYDPNEFWPSGGGAIGRGRETDIQHRKGSGKGGLNFMVAYQDQMAAQLPSTLLFEFEQRDQESVLLDAAVAQAWANVAATLYAGGSSTDPGPGGVKGGSGEPAVAPATTTPETPAAPTSPAGSPGKDNQTDGNPKDQRPAANQVKSTPVGMLTWAEARELLAMNGVIPESWTEQGMDATATDVRGPETDLQRLRETESIQRALNEFPYEPIVRYSFRTNRMETIFSSREQAYAAERFTIVKPEYRQISEDMIDVVDGNEVLRLPAPVPFETGPRPIAGGFNIYRGDTEPLKVTVRDRNRHEVNISASSQVWYTIYEKDIQHPLLLKELGHGITVERSVITVHFEPEDTLDLYGNYFHSLKVADDLGRIYTVYHGQMAVFKETVDA